MAWLAGPGSLPAACDALTLSPVAGPGSLPMCQESSTLASTRQGQSMAQRVPQLQWVWAPLSPSHSIRLWWLSVQGHWRGLMAPGSGCQQAHPYGMGDEGPVGDSAQGQPPQRDGSQAAVGWRPPRQLQGWDCWALNLLDMSFVSLAISALIKSGRGGLRRGAPVPSNPNLVSLVLECFGHGNPLAEDGTSGHQPLCWHPASSQGVPKLILSLFSCSATFFV